MGNFLTSTNKHYFFENAKVVNDNVISSFYCKERF